MNANPLPSVLPADEHDRIRREAMDFAGIGLYRYRFDGTVVFMDRGALRIMDLEARYPDPEQVRGLNIGDLLVYEGEAGRLRREIRERGHLRDFRYPFCTLTGQKRWALHNSYLVTDPVTGEEWIQVIIKDITALKAMEDALDMERERLAVTLHSIGDAVIATDTESRVVLINREAERLTGWKRQDALGRPLPNIFRIVNEDTRAPVVNPVQRVLKEGRTVGLANHTILIARDGTERPIADSGAPIFNPESRIIGVVLVFRDAEHERRIESLRLRTEKIESLGVLAGGIAHDFNNYLSGIMGNLSLARMLLASGTAAERILELLRDAEKSSERACGLTEQLLTFSRGGVPVTRPVALPDLIRRCTSFSLSGSAVNLELDLPEGLWPLKADPGQLAQIVDNIVINAKQAMAETGSLRVRAANVVAGAQTLPGLPEGRYVRLEFTDTGPGIPPQHLPRMFDPYFTTKPHGSGLGLATVYSIVRRHQGAVEVESPPDAGATIRVLWPADERAPDAEAHAGRPRTHPGGGRRVLVMDDRESVGVMARRMLAALGYAAEYVASGEQAVDACRRALAEGKPYAAVILDLTVPGGMGGVETVQTLRAFWPEVGAIATSGYSTNAVMSDYASFHFKGVIKKPYTLADLAQCLDELLDGQPPSGRPGGV